MIEYFDSHTHMQFAVYEKDREEIVKKTLEEGVGFINGGTNKKTSEGAVSLANKFIENPVYATVGLHPIHTYESKYLDKNELEAKIEVEDFDYDFYKNLALSKKVVGIGECGLDYFRLEGKSENIKDKQRQVFKKQVKLAKEVNMPLVIHCRPSKDSMDAYHDLHEILSEEEGLEDVVIHFFAGNQEMAEKFINLGCYFTFGGVITFTRDYDEQLGMVPVDKLLLETDAPYVSPLSHRGERNEPRFVKEVYERVSKLRGVGLDKLKECVLENNKKVFNIDI